MGYSPVSDEVVNISSSINSQSQHLTDDDHEGHVTQFYVAKFDFAYVDTPLLVVMWILFTAAAKIGQQRDA